MTIKESNVTIIIKDMDRSISFYQSIGLAVSIIPSINFNYQVQFFVTTILEWKHLLKEDEYKQIIIESLLFLKN